MDTKSWIARGSLADSDRIEQQLADARAMGVEAQTSELSTVLADFHKTKAERLAVVEEKQRKERAEAEKAKAKAEEEANRKQREDEEKAQRLKAQDEKKKAEGEKKKAEKEKNKAEERKRLLQIPVLVRGRPHDAQNT